MVLHLGWIVAAVMGSATVSTAVSDVEPARRLADEVMNHIADDDVNEAYSTLIPHLTRPDGVEPMLNLRDQTKKMRGAMIQQDSPLGEVEFVAREAVGRSLVRYVYLERWGRSAVVWKLTFYRGRDNEWSLLNMNWSNQADSIDKLFDTAKR